MLTVLSNPTYAKLFSAQIVALLGTGLLTVALGLLAFDIAGGDAGVVLGTAMTIKMVAYVAVSPVATALVTRWAPQKVLIGADLLRAGIAVSLPFVTQAWQIYLLVFLLQSASATFTPTFQAVIPSVLPGERDYTRALSLSRLAYDLETLLSPMLAAALLTIVSFHQLFIGTVMGFLISAMLVSASRFPEVMPAQAAPFLERLTQGVRLFWSRDELRGLLGLNLVVASSTAMVIVNTVVLVQGQLGRSSADVALLLAAYGGGSMLVALVMPRLLDTLPDRRVMLIGGMMLPLLLAAAAIVLTGWDAALLWVLLIVIWFLLGTTTSMVLTPSARLLRRNSTEENRAAVFAAQFCLSHACFLVTYPVAGIAGANLGLAPTAVVLSVLGVVGVAFSWQMWRRRISACDTAASADTAHRR